MIDMVPDPWWRVAVAVTTALLYDDEAADRAEASTARVAGLWHEAARFGVDHPAVNDAVRMCFEAAVSALDRTECDPKTKEAVADYADRYVRLGRSPADDQLQERRNTTQIAEAI
jgi:glutamate--cysteine ligase